MSIALCPYCEKMYDQDTDVEHEDECATEYHAWVKKQDEKKESTNDR